MRTRIIAACSTLALLIGLSTLLLARPAQNHEMSREEPHMSAALGHLQQAKDELERASHNKGGHRDKALQLVDQAIQQVHEGEAYYEHHDRGK